MPKRKKYKKVQENFLEEPEKKLSETQKTDLEERNLEEDINKLVEGLYYISETDAEIMPFVGGKAKAVTIEEIFTQTKSASNSPVEERDFAGFFARLTEMQDWFGDEEKEKTQKFVRLKEFLEKKLKDLKVFKIGRIQLDVYVVGLSMDGRLMGIKTKAVET